jgi:hypothetical protein
VNLLLHYYDECPQINPNQQDMCVTIQKKTSSKRKMKKKAAHVCGLHPSPGKLVRAHAMYNPFSFLTSFF